MANTHLAIWMKPQEAAACRGVQPSLSPLLTSLPLSTRNCTISAFSSMQACHGTHSHMMDCHTSVYCLSLTLRIPTAHINKMKPESKCQSESSLGSVEMVFDPLHFGLLWKAKLQSLPKSIKFNQSTGTKTMTTVSTRGNDFLLSGLLKALKYFPKQSFCGTSETANLFNCFSQGKV